MKIEESIYDGLSDSSGTSSESSSSRSSRASHGYLSTMINGMAHAPPTNNWVSLDGLHTGVPTKTTPTLTPTTLKSIEQSFLEQAFLESTISHSREAGFVPPLVEPSQPIPSQTQNSDIFQQQHEQQEHQINHHQLPHQIQHQQSHTQPQSRNCKQQHSNALLQENQNNLAHNQQLQLQSEQQQQQSRNPVRKNMGGRRPTRTVGMSPEEEERRQLRRERNKAAAARCRKRRMDHTNELLKETDSLEQVKQRLQEDIHKLQQTKEELEFILDSHRPVCRLQSSSPPDIKPVVKPDVRIDESFTEMNCKSANFHQPTPNSQNMENHTAKPNRPNSLAVGFDNNRPNSMPIFTEPKMPTRPNSLQLKTIETSNYIKSTSNEIVGIPITTPSNGIPFNFDSLMEGGTGLTPVSTPLIPSCSSQQRNNSIPVDLTSPEAGNLPKLVSL